MSLKVYSPGRVLIGLTGPAGCGKDTVAAMIPESHRIGFADPLYQGLSAMLGIPEHILRARGQKEVPLERLGKSPRHLLQTLGTEWGRDLVHPNIWLELAFWRWEAAAARGQRVIVVPDVRFRNEAEAIRAEGGEVWMVHRESVTPVASHSSETGLDARLIDRLVVNNAGLDDLRRIVAETYEQMLSA
jgi:hypothetical protein